MSNNFSRRDFLRWASAGAGAAAVGGGIWLTGRNAGDGQTGAAPIIREPRPNTTDGSTATDPSPSLTDGAPTTDGIAELPAASPPTADPAARRLVVIEMGGGNDGFSMVVPYGVGGYYDRRPRTSIAADNLHVLDDTYGLHPSLTRLFERGGFSIVQGVGSVAPNLSHFDMENRWWTGDPTRNDGYDTGVIGRLADIIGDPAAAAVAISHGQSNHVIIRANRAATMALPGSGGGYLSGADPTDIVRYQFQQAFGRFASAGGDGWLGRVRQTDGLAAGFAAKLVESEQAQYAAEEAGEEPIQYPGSSLGEGLRFAARLFAADSLTRVVHVPMRQNFDTHDNHLDQYGQIMTGFDEAIEAFRLDLARRGLAESVLIMTTSEFGRRIDDNGSNGLDHGTASTAMLIGPVANAIYGELPSLDDLDDTGNLKATVGFDQYYATVFERWLGAPNAEMFSGGVSLVGDLLA